MRRRKPRSLALVEPTMPDEKQVELFFQHLETEFEPSIVDAARFAGINKRSFDLAVAQNPAFRARLTEWQAGRDQQLEEMAFQVARRGDPAMIRFLLQSRMPQQYGNKAKVDLNVTVNTPDDLSRMSDEELAALKASLTGGGS